MASEITLGDAVAKHLVDVEAEGVGRNRIQLKLTVHRTPNVPVVRTFIIPSGTYFRSKTPGIQNTMLARTVRIGVSSAAGPQTLTVTEEVYCTERFQDPPNAGTPYALDDDHAPDALRRLSACLESSGADRPLRQLAVWMVSENLIGMTRDDAVRLFSEKMRPKVRLEALKRLQTSGMALARKTLTEEEAAAVVKEVEEEAMSGEIDAIIRKQFDIQWIQVRPLLNHCGYDLSGSPFFKGSK